MSAAIDLADANGIEQLSMRKLAAHFGTGAMTLYNHIASKDDLLAAMVDVVVGEMERPSVEIGWKPASRQLAISAHHVLQRHPWVITQWTVQWPGANRWRHMEALLEILASAGLPEDLADLAFHAITLHVQGTAQQRINYAAYTAAEDQMLDRFRRDVDAGDFPHLVDHVRYHAESQPTNDEFSFVLDLILDGLERLIPTARS